MMKARKTAKKIGHLLKETSKGFLEDDCLRLSSALSYCTIFSLPPLLIIIISLSGVFFGAAAVRGQIFGQINRLVGNNAALQIQDMIKNVKLSNSSVLATTLGIILLAIGASGVFSEIQDSMNHILGIKAKPKRGWMKFARNHLRAFSMIGTVGLLSLVGLTINSLIGILIKRLVIIFPQNAVMLFYAINTLIVLITITLLFGLIFRILPDGKIARRDCLIGASFTAFLFMIGKVVIGIYLERNNTASLLGAASSIIFILAWVYYSAAILYFGAEFTKVYAQTHGHNIVPNAYSLRIEK